jgi:hypothetical protein
MACALASVARLCDEVLLRESGKAAAEIADCLLQVNDQALFLDDDTSLFPEGWRPRLHPSDCGCGLELQSAAGAEGASPPSARIEGLPRHMCFVVVSRG